MIIVYSEGMDIFLWKDDSYQIINYPDRPRVYYDVSDKYYTTDESTGAANVLGEYFQKLKEASSENYHPGGIMIRPALKMYDGNYVLHGTPDFVNMGLSMVMTERQVPEQGEENDPNSIRFKSGKITAKFNGSQYDEMNTDIFTHVVLFACKNEELYPMDEDNLTDDLIATKVKAIANSNYEVNFMDIFDEVSTDFKNMANSSAWYNVLSVPIEEIQDAGSYLEKEVDMEDFYNDYATREALPLDQFSHHTLSGDVTFQYNSRLLVSATKTSFGQYAFFPLSLSVGGIQDTSIIPDGYSFDTNREVKLLVTLTTDSGDRKTLIDCGERPFFLKNGSSGLNKYLAISNGVIGYPDSRATRIEIIAKNGLAWYKVGTIELDKSDSGNFAYYHSDQFSVSAVNTNANYPILLYYFALTSEQYNIGTNIDDEYVDTNRVQVSEIANPLFFKAENSYQVGSGKIIGMSANTEPLSIGQFGEYPVQVFTTKGIWAMLQGTGDVLFSKIVPSSPEVALPGTITSVGYGVVFRTATGLYMISGRELTELTKDVKGTPNADFQSNANYLYYLDNSLLVEGMDNSLSDVDIVDYLVYAKIGFDNENKELFVTNSNHSYSYVYSFKTGIWSKFNESFFILINYYPKLYALRTNGADQGIISISDEDYSETVKTLLTTQPMKLGTEAFKTLQRTILRCRFTPEIGMNAGFYIFASNDLITWQRVKGINSLSGERIDIMLTRVGQKAKYYIFVFAGQISCDSYIDSLDTTIEMKLNNKLR